MAACEDTVVQNAVREVLEAIDEQDFLACAYGFRPGRSAHAASRSLDQSVHRGEVRWIREADIVSCFDRLDRPELKQRLEGRVADGSLLRLLGKGWHVGGLDGEEWAELERGPTPGAVRSPVLGNVYWHDGLDRGCDTEGKPRRRGKATLIRSWDDLLIGFEREADAQRVMAVLSKRLERFGLALHPAQTRLRPFGRPSAGQTSGTGPATVDFVGCTCSWARARTGRWGMGGKTRRASLRRAKMAIDDGCRRHRPSAGAGAARRAQSTLTRPRQLLWRQRQLAPSAAARRSHEAGLVQVAPPA
jgi:hypothetical protein